MGTKKTTAELNQLTGEIVDGFELISKSVMTPELQSRINGDVYRVITEIRNIGDGHLPRPGFLFRSEIKKLLEK